MFDCGGTIWNDTGRFLVLAREKAHEINVLDTSSGLTRLKKYQRFT
jgi:hypothetical protein